MRLLGTIPELTPDHLKLISACITFYGSGYHPEADNDTLPLFADTYAAQCVERALDALIRHPTKHPLDTKAPEMLQVLEILE